MRTTSRVASRLVLVMLAIGITACSPDSSGPTSPPEADEYKVPLPFLLEMGQSEQEVLKLAGAPPLKRTSGFSALWVYPVRRTSNTNGCCVPAPLLRIAFNSRGVVKAWGFVHPITGSTLPIKETLDEADTKRRRGCRAPPRIVLTSGIVLGVTTRADVEKLLGETFLVPIFGFKKSIEGDAETWTYYVDRPSPLFIPAFSYWVEFTHGVVTARYLQGYGGCK